MNCGVKRLDVKLVCHHTQIYIKMNIFATSGGSFVNYRTNVAQIFDACFVLISFIVVLMPSVFLIKKDAYIKMKCLFRCLLKPDSQLRTIAGNSFRPQVQRARMSALKKQVNNLGYSHGAAIRSCRTISSLENNVTTR